MAVGGNLEQQLGELTGQLRALVPALERLEDRQRKTEEHSTRAETRLEQLRTEFDEHRKSSSKNFSAIFNKTRDLEKEDGKLDARVKDLETTGYQQKEKNDSIGKKVWDVVKILLAGALGAALTKLFGG